MGPADDWRGELDRLLSGDRRAFIVLDRLVTGVLLQLRAYDYRDEWDDVRQVVLRALIESARAGRLRDGKAVAGYVRILTRQKMVEELKSSLHSPSPAVPTQPRTSSDRAASADGPGVWAAVADLADDQRHALQGVYRDGKTCQAVSEEAGIPIGAMTHRLRAAFTSLRRRLAGHAGIGDS